MINPRLGLILLFEGDFRRVSAPIANVVSFSAVTAELKNGDVDVTSTYIDTTPSSIGNLLITDKIGGKASIPAGNYRYFIHGTYGGKKRTWYWDVLVLPQNLSLISGIDFPLEDYDPFLEEVVTHEGDNFSKEQVIADLEFTAAAGVFRLLAQDMTATYCNGAAGFVGNKLSTHNIGGVTTIPAGDYGYFLTGTYNEGDAKSTWFYRVKSLPKQGVLP